MNVWLDQQVTVSSTILILLAGYLLNLLLKETIRPFVTTIFFKTLRQRRLEKIEQEVNAEINELREKIERDEYERLRKKFERK